MSDDEYGVWHHLFKYPMTCKSLISIFESYWKSLPNVSVKIDHSFFKYNHWRHSLRTDRQSHHYLPRELSSLLDGTILLSFGSTHIPYSVILWVIDSINIEQFFVGEQNIHRVLFSKMCSYPVRKFFFFSPYIRPLTMVRWPSYMISTWDHFLISDEHYHKIYRTHGPIFELTLFFSDSNESSRFGWTPFVRTVCDRPGDFDSWIVPVWRIILHQRLIVIRLTVPFKCGKISDGSSPFSYFESTSFFYTFAFHYREQ